MVDDRQRLVHLAVLTPREGRAEDLLASMRVMGGPADRHPGLRQHLIGRDRRHGRLVGITVWDSEDDWNEAVRRARAALGRVRVRHGGHPRGRRRVRPRRGGPGRPGRRSGLAGRVARGVGRAVPGWEGSRRPQVSRYASCSCISVSRPFGLDLVGHAHGLEPVQDLEDQPRHRRTRRPRRWRPRRPGCRGTHGLPANSPSAPAAFTDRNAKTPSRIVPITPPTPCARPHVEGVVPLQPVAEHAPRRSRPTPPAARR